jgi:hypothetical protein
MTLLKKSKVGISFGIAALSATTGALTGCTTDQMSGTVDNKPVSKVEQEGPAFDEAELLRSGLAKEAPEQPIFMGDAGTDQGSGLPLGKAAAGPSVGINFQDPNALALIPNANSTFVYSPGYIQSIQNSSWLYVWMSKGGPGTALIPHGTSSHFHIDWDNLCFTPQSAGGILVNNVCTTPLPANLNRYHSAMYGNEWLSAYSKKSGVAGLVNFNLTGIRVKGTVPISLWYKTANNSWFFWNSLAPGNWTLPGATNIKEFQIAATSRNAADSYSVDDIMVSTP